MSRASKITFGVTCLFTLTSIIGVHYIQEMERQTLHQGPIKDAKRMAAKREQQEKENIRDITSKDDKNSPMAPGNATNDEAKQKKRDFNRKDHALQQKLREEYEAIQPLTGEITTEDGELVSRKP